MNVNKAIKESARNVKNSNEVAEVNFQKWRESKDCFIIYEFFWLAFWFILKQQVWFTQQCQNELLKPFHS